MSKKESNVIDQIKVYSLYGYCLSAGLSIAASQVFVCSNIALFLFTKAWKTGYNSDIKQVRNAGLLWILAASISSLVGMDIAHSSTEIIRALFYFLFPFSVLDTLEKAKPRNAIVLLIASQTLAALHSLLTIGITQLHLPNTPGAVTESGQLVLIIPIAFALFYVKPKISKWLELIILFIAYMLTCYSTALGGIALLGIALYFAFSLAQYRSQEKSNFLLTLSLALLFGTLIVNLKRGPWSAVLFEFALLGFFISRSLLLITIAGSTLLLLIEPARERIFALGDHFLIYGGRYNMWTLGLEIFARFPLGLGLDNASYMRVFEPSLPSTHRHMHNNLLNIAVETGVIGLAAYLWIFYTIFLLIKNLTQYQRSEYKLLTLCLGIGIIGWQIAGLVEYNFGDAEIKLIALFIVGFLFSQSRSSRNISI